MTAWTFRGVEVTPTLDMVEGSIEGILSEAEGRELTEDEQLELDELVGLAEGQKLDF